MSRPAIGCRARAGARHGAGREETSLVWSAEIGTGGEGGGRGGGNGEREEGVRACDWAGRNAFGARVSTGRCIIYNGNTIESNWAIWLTRASLLIFFFFLLHHCEITLKNILCIQIYFLYIINDFK
jgi:hypothetical protein